MGGVIIVAGTPGAGKSSALAGLEEKAKIINMGTEMLAVAKRLKGVEDRDKLRHLKPSEIAEIREATIKGINGKKGNVILDTHASVKTGEQYVPGFSTGEISKLKLLKGIIYIDADAKDIIIRRNADKTRKRENETEEEIAKHRMLNLAFVATYAAQANVPIYLIENPDGHLAETRAKIKKIMEEVFGT